MKEKDVKLAAGVVLGLAGLFHLIRLVSGWSITINNYNMPSWLSLLLVLIAGYLSYSLLKK